MYSPVLVDSFGIDKLPFTADLVLIIILDTLANGPYNKSSGM